jgi:superfamily II DNA helicase RecQ
MHQRRLILLQHKQHTDPTATTPPITGIIYVPLRATADTLSTKLTSAGIQAQAYHAGLEPETRTKVQSTFLHLATTDSSLPPATQDDEMTIASSFNIICATTAFGMGIDVPGIRFVIHYGLPRGMESFTQESGRAGRDGKAASSVILYTREEKERVLFRVRSDVERERKNKSRNKSTMDGNGNVNAKAESRMQSVESVVAFCENVEVCRHVLLGRYFGDGGGGGGKKKQGANGKDSDGVVCEFACDVCKEGQSKLKKRKELGLASTEQAWEFTQREPVAEFEYE